MPTIGFLHTSATHRPTFDGLITELDPAITTVVVVDEPLLDDARRLGPEHASVITRITDALVELDRAGASIVVCTCSTIGHQAEEIGRRRGQAVVRVDRALAEAAVASGPRITIVAALESTIAPTRALIESVASDRGLVVDVSTVLARGAWDLFAAGDRDGYLRTVAETCVSVGSATDVIVLAQASMAAAADLLPPWPPTLASPRLAAEAVVASIRSPPQISPT